VEENSPSPKNCAFAKNQKLGWQIFHPRILPRQEPNRTRHRTGDSSRSVAALRTTATTSATSAAEHLARRDHSQPLAFTLQDNICEAPCLHRSVVPNGLSERECVSHSGAFVCAWAIAVTQFRLPFGCRFFDANTSAEPRRTSGFSALRRSSRIVRPSMSSHAVPSLCEYDKVPTGRPSEA
jgi:hypothetical protein